MSFFDEADEPSVTPRTERRGRGPSGTGRRPPTDSQAIMIRRAIAAGVILVVLILIIVFVHSCQQSARISALKDYANNVASLEKQSVNTGSTFFKQLQSGTSGGANAQTIENQINDTRVNAQSQLGTARKLNVPDEMKATQQDLLQTLQMRLDGIGNIATQVQPAFGHTVSKDALDRIAAEMARFYASDVLYKDYAVPLMVGALRGAGIAVGGINGIPIEGGQFLTNLGWLTPTTAATLLNTQLSTPGGKPTPGTHGHSLDSVSVSGTTLQPNASSTLPRTPPPTFTFHFTNGGQNVEHSVILKILIPSAHVNAQSVVAQTSPGQSTTGTVALTSSPPAGSYSVTATVQPVLGEKNTSNNTQVFQITFQ